LSPFPHALTLIPIQCFTPGGTSLEAHTWCIAARAVTRRCCPPAPSKASHRASPAALRDPKGASGTYFDSPVSVRLPVPVLLSSPGPGTGPGPVFGGSYARKDIEDEEEAPSGSSWVDCSSDGGVDTLVSPFAKSPPGLRPWPRSAAPGSRGGTTNPPPSSPASVSLLSLYSLKTPPASLHRTSAAGA